MSSVSSHGYVLIYVGKDHHLADVRGYAYEHRIVAEKKLGRRLLPGEVVHHINEIKADNDPVNIEVVKSIAVHRFKHRNDSSRLRLPLLSALTSMPRVLGDGGIDWVIGGGESQDGARPSHPAWYRGLANACSLYGVPFLFKQWGEWLPYSQRSSDVAGHWSTNRVVTIDYSGLVQQGEEPGWASNNKTIASVPTAWVGKKAAGRLLDGHEYNGLPAYWPSNVGLPVKVKKSKNPLEVIA